MQCPDQPGKGPRVGFPASSGRKTTCTDGPDVGHFMQDPSRISLIAHSRFTDAQTEAQRQEVVTQRVEGATSGLTAGVPGTQSCRVHRGRAIPQENGAEGSASPPFSPLVGPPFHLPLDLSLCIQPFKMKYTIHLSS